MSFVHLHWYSTFSFLESIGSPKTIVKTAKSLGQDAIALTDLGVIYGAIQHYKAGKDEEINAIVGVEFGFVLDVQSAIREKEIWTLVLLSKDFEWYQNLLNLTSFAWQEWIAGKPKIDLPTLKKYAGQLIWFTGGTNSRIAKMLNNGESLEKVKEILSYIIECLGKENFYFEIIAQDHRQHPEIQKINQTILQLAEEFALPCFLSNIYLYPLAENKTTQELAMAIKDNLRLYDPTHRSNTTLHHIMSEQEIRQIALDNWYSQQQVDLWCDTTLVIAEQCHTKIAMGQMLFPKYEAQPEIAELYAKYGETMVEIESKTE